MASRFGDLDRPPLSAPALARALTPDGWRVEVLTSTGSTNAVVAARARAGEPAGLVVVAEEQTAGRGRLDRTWTSPPRAGLTLSVLLRPDWPTGRWPWLPLLAGLAVARTVREQGEVDAELKWPNDVVLGPGAPKGQAGRKLCGVLVEVPEPGAAVVGIGLNVTTRQAELPHPGATSLQLAGAATTDRDTLLRALLRALRDALADPEAAREDYRRLCGTIGREVALQLPGTDVVRGTACAVDDGGRLVVDGVPYAAGDVVHATPLSP